MREIPRFSLEKFSTSQRERQDNHLSLYTIGGYRFDVTLPLEKTDFVPSHNLNAISSLRDYLAKHSDSNFFNNGQNLLHASTIALISANWQILLDEMGLLAETERTFCFPEVSFNCRRETALKERFATDCIGYGGNGLVFVTEVGVRGKRKQLSDELAMLRSLFGKINFVGILASYKARGFQTIKVDLSFTSL